MFTINWKKSNLEEVYKLRYREYLRAGHVNESISKMITDKFDETSDILQIIDEEFSKVIGTLRIIHGNLDLFEGRDYIKPHVDNPLSNDYAELTKLAIDFDYRSRKKEFSILLFIGMALKQYCDERNINRLYIITIDKNAKLYEKYGFKRFPEGFTYLNYNREHYVLSGTRGDEYKLDEQEIYTKKS